MSPLRDHAGMLHERYAGTPRIVSLVPSLTELVCDLGLGEALVGRTGFCVHPREALRGVPKLGGTKDVKLDALAALEPTHVLVNVDENRRETVDALRAFVPHILVTHPLVPEDNLALYALVGGVFGREAQAARLATAYTQAAARLAAVAAGLARERVLYLIWKDPWMSIARDTYISAMLAAAGWDTLPAAADARYPVLDVDAPWLAEVQRVLLPSEPYAFRDTDAEVLRGDARLGAVPVNRIDGEMVSWYGSRAVLAMDYLADLRGALAQKK